MAVKLLISGKFEIGNGYRCSCCSRTDESRFDGMSLVSLISEIQSICTYEDDLHNIDPGELSFDNLGEHHDSDQLREHIANICNIEIDRCTRLHKTQKKIKSMEESRNASQSFIANIEARLKNERANIEKQTTDIAVEKTNLDALMSKAPKIK